MSLCQGLMTSGPRKPVTFGIPMWGLNFHIGPQKAEKQKENDMLI